MHHIETRKNRSLTQAIDEAITASIDNDETVTMDYSPGLLRMLFAECEDYQHDHGYAPVYWGVDQDGQRWQIQVEDAPEPEL